MFETWVTQPNSALACVRVHLADAQAAALYTQPGQVGDVGRQHGAIVSHDSSLEGGRERQSLGALLRTHQLVLVACKRRPKAGLKPFVHPVLLAALDNGRESEKAREQRHHSEKHEIND